MICRIKQINNGFIVDVRGDKSSTTFLQTIDEVLAHIKDSFPQPSLESYPRPQQPKQDPLQRL
jgi:hypothetical protein